ncbi:L,D-transpeptidase [Cumulibacter manganitolerans]|uniref:L,D-transpeptidase n=1 Tax=Cumulibacter manganitolerans TaxID=1884992 RepID=UPI001E369944|nr:Ig-like domain-containing protein [Cumulibacter manganitolerans]
MSTPWTARPMTRRSLLAGLGLGSAVALAACTTGAAGGSGRPSASTSPTPTKPKLPDATISVSVPDGAADQPPTVPLTVTAAGGTLDVVTVSTADGAKIEGKIDPATATWTASEPLAYDAKYTVLATATNADNSATQVTSKFSTVAPTARIYPGIGPLDGTTVGVAMPIRVYFDHAVSDRKAIEEHLKVTATPAQTGSWCWFGDKEVHWRPQGYWQAGSTVQVDVKIFGVDAGKGAWGKTDRSIKFKVGAAHVSRCNTAEHQLYCFENGQLVKSIPVAAGKEEVGRYTHSGIHVVIDKQQKMTMDSTTYGLALDAGGYQTEVAWATRISNNGEFVHAAPWSLADQGVRNVSHGCLNASPDDAKWFLQWSQIGDPVEITGTPVPLTQADGDIYDWTIDWATWQQGSALK